MPSSNDETPSNSFISGPPSLRSRETQLPRGPADGAQAQPPTENGRYVDHELIGRGGMGIVWKATDTRLNRIVALKRVLPQIAGEREYARRFLEEARAVAKLDHPHIVRVWDLRDDLHGDYLVLEYVPGKSLLERLATGPLTLTTSLEWMLQLCDGLAMAHANGIVHRDIKPANILLTADGKIKLTDFGLAKSVSGSPASIETLSGFGLGTDGYMAPEQYENAKDATPASDQYALAATFYHMVTGRSPKKIDMRRVPEPLVAVLDRALEDAPDDRYASIDDFRRVLADILRTLKVAESAGVVRSELPTREKAVPASPTPAVAPARAPAPAPAVPRKASPPDLLVAPFTLNDALQRQADWAQHLNQPVDWTNSLGMKFRLIPPGEFLMGNEETLESLQKAFPYVKPEWVNSAFPRHRVRITRPFYLGVYPVSVGEFRRFVAATNYRTEAERDGHLGHGWNAAAQEFQNNPEFSWRDPGFPQSDQHPVVNVSWNDTQAMIEWLTKTCADRRGSSYGLPTEAQFEYACRAGTTTRFYNGDDPERLREIANVLDGTAKDTFKEDEDGAFIQAKDGYAFTSPAGVFLPNAFGLHDMTGNVFEWCADDMRPYSQDLAVDPRGPDSPGSLRCLRGGSWDDDAVNCRSAYRFVDVPADRCFSNGFRVLLGVV